MRKGDKVIIAFNPHEKGADKVIGTVTDYRPGIGFGGCDMVDVEYVSPNDGQTYVYPYGRHNLQETSAAGLIALAEHYEKKAKEFRELAAKASDKE